MQLNRYSWAKSTAYSYNGIRQKIIQSAYPLECFMICSLTEILKINIMFHMLQNVIQSTKWCKDKIAAKCKVLNVTINNDKLWNAIQCYMLHSNKCFNVQSPNFTKC